MVTRIPADAGGAVTGDPVDSLLFEVALDAGETPDLLVRYTARVRVEEHEAVLREQTGG
jgi:hypothetical protein